jgi:hypothetical protein
VVADRKPSAAVLDVTPVFLETESAVGPHENVHAPAAVLGLDGPLDFVQVRHDGTRCLFLPARNAPEALRSRPDSRSLAQLNVKLEPHS